ncbi:MAG: N-acetylmuramoyl-L-alanine amidase [Candidatus Sumerlaeaceae bacterium]|nr:N-acetylmuramoyl-L-alanine amidase [Candidatus Sumerlaeaceae bacterium]
MGGFRTIAVSLLVFGVALLASPASSAPVEPAHPLAEVLADFDAQPREPLMLAQFGWFTRREPEATPAPRRATPAPTPEESLETGEYVWAKDLSEQLKKIDPKADVDWDGRVLRIKANGQKFSLFTTVNDMVANGVSEKIDRPLRVSRGEIYVPQTTIELIGKRLEEGPKAGTDATSTALATATPTPTLTPLPSPTPTPTVAQVTPAPTPEVAAGLPTPAPVATPFPEVKATPATVVEVIATPTPTPKPVVASVPTKTPRAGRGTKATPIPAPAVEVKADGNALYQQSLRDKSEVGTYRIPKFTLSELQSAAGEAKVRKVVVDPDDGDPAAGRLSEEVANINLEIARKIKGRLESSGISVELTRDSNKRIPPGKKLEIITNSGAQALISVRIGASDFPDVGGTRVLFTNDSVDSRGNQTLTKQSTGSVPTDLNYLPFQQRNNVLGSALLNALKGLTGGQSAGINPVPLYLQRRAPMASALVVVGYITNPADAKRLRDPAEQDKIADALAEGVVQFGGHMDSGSSVAGTRTAAVGVKP